MAAPPSPAAWAAGLRWLWLGLGLLEGRRTARGVRRRGTTGRQREEQAEAVDGKEVRGAWEGLLRVGQECWWCAGERGKALEIVDLMWHVLARALRCNKSVLSVIKRRRRH